MDPAISAHAGDHEAVLPESGRERLKQPPGVRVERRFTRRANGEILEPYATVTWTERDVSIGDGGAVPFEQKRVEAPTSWSQTAVDILATKYLRRSVATLPEGRETSARQAIARLVSTWRHWGEAEGYFRTLDDAKAFEDELAFMLLHQMAAPNSPQWFNTGLAHAYGIRGSSQGNAYVDVQTGEIRETHDAYSRPQVHACFINSVEDSLIGITDLLSKEAKIFKYGSGAGTNFSAIRGEGEPLSGGGTSSGLMSFLRVFDAAAGAIKSGGTTRRAAKMVCLDADHPDILAFVRWKANEERKAMLLIEHGGFPRDFNGEAYQTVSGQNSNNSVRVPDAFLRAVERAGEWTLIRRTDGGVARTLWAQDLWREIAAAAWACADPGLQFHTTINEWHTCPESGRIASSNPCGEYVFVDNTACNLASLNLTKFLRAHGTRERFDVEAFGHACRLWTIVLDISNSMASFPSKIIAHETARHRTIGLGYCGLGAMLMAAGVPYDSPSARAIAGAITAMMAGEAYATSAELARELGSFPAFEDNRDHMLRVIRNHRRAAYGATDFEGLSQNPQPLDDRRVPSYLLRASREAWDRAIEGGEAWGYRNAQTTVLAPTGTIGLVMDSGTTGIEPVYALLARKKLAGGSTITIAQRSVEPGLWSLGYGEDAAKTILAHIERHGTIDEAPHLRWEHRPVFAAARELSGEGHLRMMAAVQPFLSGAISKTVNMPEQTTPDEIGAAYLRAWKLGLKSIAIYRDGSKGAQVMEDLRPSEYEPPSCVACGEGTCELPNPKRRATPFDQIPDALKGNRFVVYGPDKVPLDPKTGRAASVTRPDTWASFQEAVRFIERNPRAVGPGLILRAEDRVVCLDLDGVIDPVEGAKPFAAALVARFGSYTEVSLSKRGLHILFKVNEVLDFPGGRWAWKTKDGSFAFEAWYVSRYIALTGKIWKWSRESAVLEERTEELRNLLAESESARAPIRASESPRVNKEAMMELFDALGIAISDDPGRKLVRCFLPRHVDHHPSLSIHPERGWFCHGCRQGGGAVRLRELISEFTDDEVQLVAERTGAPESKILAVRERLRREQDLRRLQRSRAQETLFTRPGRTPGGLKMSSG